MIIENKELDYLDFPLAESQNFLPHPLRFRSKQLVGVAVFFLMLLVGPILVFFAGEHLLSGILFLACILLVIFQVITVFKSFPVRGYAIREHDISYRKGWIFYSIITIPFNRIQHSEISQGPIDRIFKLSSVKIYTAGGSGSDLSIPGLDPENAQQLRDFIAKEASEHE